MSDHLDDLEAAINAALDRFPLINLERGEYEAVAATAADAVLAAGWLPTATAQSICDEAAGRAISEAVRDGWREDIVRGIFLARDAIRAALDVAPSDERRAM